MVTRFAFALALLASVAALKLESSSQGCECLNWAGVYTNKTATCGRVNEFYFVGHTQHLVQGDWKAVNKVHGESLCKWFYIRFDDNHCINVNQGADKGQWCFVDPECQNLNGGATVKHMQGKKLPQASWKMCQQGQDKMLRDLAPEQMGEFAKTRWFDVVTMHKMTYPTNEDYLWNQVSTFFKGSGSATADQFFEGEPLSEKAKTDIQAIVDKGEPVSFDTNSNHTKPRVIVHGKKVYFVTDGVFCANCDK